MKKLNEEDVKIVYNNQLQLMCQLIDTNNLWAEVARGTGKSSEILASRTVRVAADMPQSTLIFGGATYISLMQTIVPTVMSYWRKYYIEGVHFVVGKKPPQKWKQSFIRPYEYKHTISTVWGNTFRLVSIDRPESSAGISAAHGFFDELKHIDSAKLMSRVFPTFRGDRYIFGSSHYFQGITGVSDTARIDLGEDDWFFEMEKNMDWTLIEKIANIAMHINKAQYNILRQKNIGKNKHVIKIWQPALNALRKQATFYIRGSAFYNKEILGIKFFKDMKASLSWEDFKSSILNIRQSEVPNKFFISFSDKNIYTDSYNYHRIDRLSLGEGLSLTAADLKYYRPDLPLYTGTDFGNMTSMVVGQEYGGKFYILKNFHALNNRSEYLPELARMFHTFFKDHQNKQIYSYFDRAGNNYGHRSEANYLRSEFETEGWVMRLMSVKRDGTSFATVEHGEYYDLFNIIFSENTDNIIKIRICNSECKELISSIRLSPTKYEQGKIKLDKSSEKLRNPDELPMRSTNYATAMWYVVYGMYNKLKPRSNNMKDYNL